MTDKRLVRAAGAFYALTILGGILGEFLSMPLGLAFQMIAVVSYVAVTALLYELFATVERRLSLLAAFFSIVGIAILAVSDIALFSDSHRLHAQGYVVADVFFGIYCLLIGYMIVRSKILPAVIGALMALAGASYLFDSFAVILAPAFAHSIGDYALLPGLIGEGALTISLLVPMLQPPEIANRPLNSR